MGQPFPVGAQSPAGEPTDTGLSSGRQLPCHRGNDKGEPVNHAAAEASRQQTRSPLKNDVFIGIDVSKK